MINTRNAGLLLGLGILGTLALAPASAQIITQFNFNSLPTDNATGTGTLTPNIDIATGTPTATNIGGTSFTYASGNANGGSTDPETSANDSGWNITTFPAQGTNNKTAGVQFTIDTTGFNNLVLTFDQRHSNSSSRFVQVQYTTDGINYLDAQTFSGPAGDTWFNNRTVGFQGIAGVNNNPNFGVRIVSTFGTATDYISSGAGTAAAYSTAGTWRFDQVTLQSAPVPAPSSVAVLALGGLMPMVAIARRRRSAK